VFGRAWKIGSVGGIAIRVDSSWIIIALLITASLWSQFAEVLDTAPGAALALALVTAVLFFGSVLVHELAHAGMARARRIEVSGITLFLFGGATSARMEDRGAVDEFLVTVVGPLSSAALGGLFLVVDRADVLAVEIDRVMRYIGVINIALAIFNLVPGFPLDGGRILRSLIWKATGNLDRATTIAAGVGMVVAAGLIALGLYRAFTEDPSGLSISGLWLALIGWFLFQGARGATTQRRFRRVLSQGTAGEAMGPPPQSIPGGISLSEALDHLRGHEDQAFPVVEDGRLVGALTFEAARRVGQQDPMRPVRDAMVPADRMLSYAADEPLDRVAEGVGEGDPALVLRDGEVVGSITAEHVYRWLRQRSRA
jgi:Zn-dependent protease